MNGQISSCGVHEVRKRCVDVSWNDFNENHNIAILNIPQPGAVENTREDFCAWALESPAEVAPSLRLIAFPVGRLGEDERKSLYRSVRSAQRFPYGFVLSGAAILSGHKSEHCALSVCTSPCQVLIAAVAVFRRARQFLPLQLATIL